jgi:hypothetical protein
MLVYPLAIPAKIIKAIKRFIYVSYPALTPKERLADRRESDYVIGTDGVITIRGLNRNNERFILSLAGDLNLSAKAVEELIEEWHDPERATD